MATFITLVRFTQQGVTTMRDTCQRAANFKTAAKKMGVKVKEVYWTLGAFDGVAVFEADDDETATAAMLQLASQGNVQTQTARAFTATEMETILGRIAK
jgi:uncharacterized protein with GYD domain